jgi:hypothetical protein
VRSARLTLLSGAVAPVAVEVLDVFPELPLPPKPGPAQRALRRARLDLKVPAGRFWCREIKPSKPNQAQRNLKTFNPQPNKLKKLNSNKLLAVIN